MRCDEVLKRIKSLANPANVEGMARYGINPSNTYGVSIPTLRAMAKETGKDHLLAQQLWASGIHEARILASIIDVPAMVDEEQMESWVGDLDSWDVCDQCCANLFWKTALAHEKAIAWSESAEQFVKRAGFALMAVLAVHDKKANDAAFARFLLATELAAADERNFVKKAVNWALRQIGKRNYHLNGLAVETAKRMVAQDSRAARWIGSDALRELTSEKVQEEFRRDTERYPHSLDPNRSRDG